MSDSAPESLSSEPASGNPQPETPEYLFVAQVVAPFGVKGAVKATVYTEFPERLGKLEGVVLMPYGAVDPNIAPSGGLDPASLKVGVGSQPGGDLLQKIESGPKNATTFGIESASVHKGQFILKLAGIDTVASAEGLRGYWVMLPREQAKRLPRGSYYLYELVGLAVFDTAGEHIGNLDEVITSAANDVYVVRGSGVNDLTGELLVPAVKAVVKKVDVAGGKLVIAPVSEWT